MKKACLLFILSFSSDMRGNVVTVAAQKSTFINISCLGTGRTSGLTGKMYNSGSPLGYINTTFNVSVSSFVFHPQPSIYSHNRMQ